MTSAYCGLPVMFILRCGLPIDGTQEHCDNFSEDYPGAEAWLAVRKRSAPAEEKFRWQRSPDFPMTAAPFPLRQVRRTARYVSTFVTNLTRLDLFSSITYDGYSLSDSVYTYTVNAVFKSAETTRNGCRRQSCGNNNGGGTMTTEITRKQAVLLSALGVVFGRCTVCCSF